MEATGISYEDRHHCDVGQVHATHRRLVNRSVFKIMHSSIVRFLSVILGVVLTSPVFATQYALVVGINEYTNPGCPTLAGCVRDANRMVQMLTSSGGGWTPSNIKTLTNANASRTAVLNALSTFANKAASGDVFIYHQSSHGGNQTLSCADADITASDLGKALRNFKSGVKVLCVIDACHSGSLPNRSQGIVRKPMDFGGFIRDVNTAMGDDASSMRGTASVRITNSEIGWCVAAASDTTSGDLGNGFGGLFSYPFIQGAMTGSADSICYNDYDSESEDGIVDLSVGNGDGKITATETFFAARSAVRAYTGGEQIPEIYNQSVCNAVVLSRISQVDLNQAADSDLHFYSYAWDVDSGYYAYGNGWFGQTSVSSDGRSALQSSTVLPFCECTLDTVVSGSGKISFNWKVSSSTGTLALYVDDNLITSIKGNNGGWKSYEYNIEGEGSHLVAWTYYADTRDDPGENCGWIDQISWSSSDSINAILDSPYLSYETFGQGNVWLGEDPSDGSLEMDVAGENSILAVQTTVQGPCIVDFWWTGVSSGSPSISGLFMIGDDVVDSVEMTGAWQQGSWVLSSASSYGLLWGAISQGASSQGIVWLDEVAVSPRITLNANGGSGTLPDFMSVNSSVCQKDSDGNVYVLAGSTVTVPGQGALSNGGLEFVGWSVNGAEFAPGATFVMPAKPTTLTAVWRTAGGSGGGDITDDGDSSGPFGLTYPTYTAVMAKGTWNGYMMDDYGCVIGTVSVKAAALKNSKSKVTFAITYYTGKTRRVKGEMSLNLSGRGFDCTAVGDGAVVNAYFRHQNVWGRINGFYFDCARDFSADKDKATAGYRNKLKSLRTNYVMSFLSIPRTGKTILGNGFVGVSLAVGAKGKTKITGVLPDGSKVNGTSYLIQDGRGSYLPVWTQASARKGYFGGLILSMESMLPAQDKIGDWRAPTHYSWLQFDDASRVSASRPSAQVCSLYMPSYFGAYPTTIGGAPILMDALPGYSAPTAIQCNGKKWVPLSNNSCQLKLQYVPKTGLIKGSYTIFTTTKRKYRANVNGAYIHGWGDIHANVKGRVSMPMMIGLYR